MTRRPAYKQRLCIERLEDRLTPSNDTVAGAIAFPFPTINNISIEWPITGDDNLNAAVTVQYRRLGDVPWSTGMDLRRIPAGANVGFTWPNKLAGSIFDVQSNTTYEVQLSLTDPDGGSVVRTGTVTTRAVPAPMAGAPIRNATPATLNSVLSTANPGDIIELGAGSYSPFTVTHNGAAGQPIVIRDSNGDAVINGPGGAGNAIDLTNRSFVIVDGLTINNGRVKLNGANTVAVVRCTINASADGILALTVAQNLYIADNRLIGQGQWLESQLGANGFDGGEGIQVIGPGHVVEHNYVKGFRDLISLIEDSPGSNQRSIDIIDNDLAVATDDGIEADFSEGNVRVMRNRLTNCFMGISSQPSLGGPTYFIRNAMYNIILHAFKLHRGSVGDVGLHNTIVKNGDAFSVYSGVPHSRGFFRNNLFIGGPGGVYNTYDNGPGRVTDLQYADASNSFNFDAYGSTAPMFYGRIGAVSFVGLTQMRAMTTETNAVQVDLGVFNASVAYPSNPLASEMAPPDMRLRAGSAAENAGQFIPNIDDGYAGTAPDMGAFEFGAAVPAYGPRAAPRVTSMQINDGSAQRSRVTSVTLAFNYIVSFAGPVASAFTLARTSGGGVSFAASANIINGVTVVTLSNFTGSETEFGSLSDGRFTLTALANQISAGGLQLDGNGDGTGGDDYHFGDTQGLFRLFGDVNGDQTVNGFDLGFFRNSFGTQLGDANYLGYMDFNGDGVINGFDLGQFRTRFGTMLP